MGELPIKLYSYHKYIGNSTLIAGIITSYKKEIFDKLDPSKSSREGKVRRVHSGIKSDFIDSLSINVGLTILIYPLTLIVPGLLWCIWKIFGGEVEIFESCLNWALTKASIYAIVYLVCSSILITLKIIGDYFFKYKPLVVEIIGLIKKYKKNLKDSIMPSEQNLRLCKAFQNKIKCKK